jgi:hypothetical protein
VVVVVAGRSQAVKPSTPISDNSKNMEVFMSDPYKSEDR